MVFNCFCVGAYARLFGCLHVRVSSGFGKYSALPQTFRVAQTLQKLSTIPLLYFTECYPFQSLQWQLYY